MTRCGRGDKDGESGHQHSRKRAGCCAAVGTGLQKVTWPIVWTKAPD